ncbi:MAG: hypothetical protein ACLGHC_08545 [Alphaproteobacteria bacterium]
MSVVLPARVFTGRGWDDACILNLSSRGLMVYSLAPAQPGSYVELRRGGQEITARVVWRSDKRMGLVTRDRIPVAQVISGEELPSIQVAAETIGLERRKVARDADRNRFRGRMAEFVGIAFFGAALAVLAYNAVMETLGRSLAEVTLAFGGG